MKISAINKTSIYSIAVLVAFCLVNAIPTAILYADVFFDQDLTSNTAPQRFGDSIAGISGYFSTTSDSYVTAISFSICKYGSPSDEDLFVSIYPFDFYDGPGDDYILQDPIATSSIIADTSAMSNNSCFNAPASVTFVEYTFDFSTTSIVSGDYYFVLAMGGDVDVTDGSNHYGVRTNTSGTELQYDCRNDYYGVATPFCDQRTTYIDYLIEGVFELPNEGGGTTSTTTISIDTASTTFAVQELNLNFQLVALLAIAFIAFIGGFWLSTK